MQPLDPMDLLKIRVCGSGNFKNGGKRYESCSIGRTSIKAGKSIFTGGIDIYRVNVFVLLADLADACSGTVERILRDWCPIAELSDFRVAGGENYRQTRTFHRRRSFFDAAPYNPCRFGVFHADAHFGGDFPFKVSSVYFLRMYRGSAWSKFVL